MKAYRSRELLVGGLITQQEAKKLDTAGTKQKELLVLSEAYILQCTRQGLNDDDYYYFINLVITLVTIVNFYKSKKIVGIHKAEVSRDLKYKQKMLVTQNFIKVPGNGYYLYFCMPTFFQLKVFSINV